MIKENPTGRVLLDKLIPHIAQMICAREKYCKSLASEFTLKLPLRSGGYTLWLSLGLLLKLSSDNDSSYLLGQ